MTISVTRPCNNYIGTDKDKTNVSIYNWMHWFYYIGPVDYIGTGSSDQYRKTDISIYNWIITISVPIET
jgi:hypothetical protein